jgi:hypothetical protein
VFFGGVQFFIKIRQNTMREGYDLERATNEAEEIKRVAEVIEDKTGVERGEQTFDSLTYLLAAVNVDAQKRSREFRKRMSSELSREEVDLTEAYTDWKGEELKLQDQYYVTREGSFDHYRFQEDIRKFLGEDALKLYLKESELRGEAYKNAEQEAMKVYRAGEHTLKQQLERGEITQEEFAETLSGLQENFESTVQQAMQSHKPLIHIEIDHVEGDGATFATSRTRNTYAERGDKVDSEPSTNLLFASEGAKITRGKEIVNESDRRASDHGPIYDREVVIPYEVGLNPGQFVIEQTGGSYRILVRE